MKENARGSFALANVLLVLCLSFPHTSDAAEPKGSFSSFRPLSLERLYTNRLRFTSREPMISVGLMEGQERIELSATMPVRLMFEEDDIPKTLYAQPGKVFRLEPLSAKPGRVLHWIVVFSAKEKGVAEAELKKRKRAHPEARLAEVGTLNVLRGRVLDTRSFRVIVGGYLDRRRAEKEMGKLIVKASDSSEVYLHEELVQLPSGTIGIFNERGRLLHRAKDSVYAGTTQGHRVDVKAVEFGRGYRWHNREDRTYRGHLYVVLDSGGKLALVNSVGAESLLRGLVPAEIFASAPIEALKAQAVTARGEIFSKLGHRHFSEPFHLCSEQHCQVYSGAKSEQSSTDKAVRATKGLLAVRPRKTKEDPLEIVDTFYSSTCGGFSETNVVVWGTPSSPSLVAKLDAIRADDPALERFKRGLDPSNIRAFLDSYPPAECARSKFTKPKKFRWKKTFPKEAVDAITEPLGIGTLKDIEILGRGRGGRVYGIRLKGTEGDLEVLRELRIRRMFANLNSGMFVVDIERDASGALSTLTFTGGGWGHGVGMCQVGAVGRAERGQTFEQILSHYYTGAVVEPIY